MKFTVHLPPYSAAVLSRYDMSGVRSFEFHDTFASYLQAWADAGHVVTWSDSHTAHVASKVPA